jgi:hypothetical protein
LLKQLRCLMWLLCQLDIKLFRLCEGLQPGYSASTLLCCYQQHVPKSFLTAGASVLHNQLASGCNTNACDSASPCAPSSQFVHNAPAAATAALLHQALCCPAAAQKSSHSVHAGCCWQGPRQMTWHRCQHCQRCSLLKPAPASALRDGAAAPECQLLLYGRGRRKLWSQHFGACSAAGQVAQGVGNC